jgi:hypothetical protein
MDKQIPLQDLIDKNAPIRNCYGCGADNHKGMRLKTFLEGDEGVSHWNPEPHYCSYPGFLNGGVACSLIDCHSAWTAFALECRENGLDLSADPNLPTGWTRAMSVEFLKPTPIDSELTLRAKIIKKGKTSRTLTCSLFSGDLECVRGEVTIIMM